VKRSLIPLGLAITLVGHLSVARAGEILTSPPAESFPGTVAVAWFDLLYDVVKAEHVTPPQAARTYGLAAVALYEAIVPGSFTHRSLVGQLNELVAVPQPKRFRRHHWPTVANSALSSMTRTLFPSASQSSLEAIMALEHAFATAFQDSVRPSVYARSVSHGQAIAGAISAWAATDGLSTLNDCPYTPPVGPGLWEPTPPGFAPEPLQPCWGQLRPMVLPSSEVCSPPAHPPYAEDPKSEFYAQAFTVYHTAQTLTPEQQTIAHYWADSPGTTGTPPGHWIAIMSQLARHDDLSLMAAAEGFVRVGLAVADAFIGCWHTKYFYNLLRPVTYIQHHIDPAWLPLLSTPNFPEYTSGHSVQSAAAAAVLTAMFGIRSFTDTLHPDHDLPLSLEPRTFSSFEAAAEEAALSRLYGGIHYPFASTNGLLQGRCIGQMITDRVKFKW
jgi:membrane-associated phospholipid phosphatase